MKLLGKWIGDIFVQEEPTGTVNGSNTAFTLSEVPHSNACVELYLNGLILRQGTDYSLSGSSITMTTAPVSGSDLYATYIKV